MPAAITAVMAEVFYTVRLQLRLAFDLHLVYDIPLAADDPEELTRLFAVVYGVKVAEVVGLGLKALGSRALGWRARAPNSAPLQLRRLETLLWLLRPLLRRVRGGEWPIRWQYSLRFGQLSHPNHCYTTLPVLKTSGSRASDWGPRAQSLALLLWHQPEARRETWACVARWPCRRRRAVSPR